MHALVMLNVEGFGISKRRKSPSSNFYFFKITSVKQDYCLVKRYNLKILNVKDQTFPFLTALVIYTT
jgi:hypothetical protein